MKLTNPSQLRKAVMRFLSTAETFPLFSRFAYEFKSGVLRLTSEAQLREWLMRLNAAADDCCQARWIAQEIQRRSRLGHLHSSATECRIASARATTYGTRHPRDQACRTIAALRRALEDHLAQATAYRHRDD